MQHGVTTGTGRILRRRGMTRGGVFVALLLLCGACAYSFRGTLPPHLDSIAIPLMENRTPEAGITEDLTDLLREEFLQEGLFKVSSLERADCRLDATLLSVSERADNFTDEDVVTNIRLSLRVEVHFVDLVEDRELWVDTFNEFGLFDPDSETRDDAIDEAVEKLVQKINQRILSDW